MSWNLEKKTWLKFNADFEALASHEAKFLRNSGMLFESFSHLDKDGKNALQIDLLSEEAFRTSEIEGNYLNRESLQTSLCRHFGLQTEKATVPPAEQGISDMMIHLYESWDQPLSHELLWSWNRLLLQGRTNIKDAGRYRTDADPMLILSGPVHKPIVHFQAPLSTAIPEEMKTFIHWFNQSTTLPALSHAGIAHLWFVCIHPFEDGNGRIARALCEKAHLASTDRSTHDSKKLSIEYSKKALMDFKAA